MRIRERGVDIHLEIVKTQIFVKVRYMFEAEIEINAKNLEELHFSKNVEIE